VLESGLLGLSGIPCAGHGLIILGSGELEAIAE
jgi:hypothetical protein